MIESYEEVKVMGSDRFAASYRSRQNLEFQELIQQIKAHRQQGSRGVKPSKTTQFDPAVLANLLFGDREVDLVVARAEKDSSVINEMVSFTIGSPGCSPIV